MHMTYEIYCYGMDSKGKKSLEHSLEQQYQKYVKN